MKREGEPIQPKPLHTKKSLFWRIGHRGYPNVAPENTMASFEKAVEAGVDMIEFDVALSKDGIPVILHDSTLNRTTNGKGRVKAKTLRELKELDAGSWFSPPFSGEEIPTLSEVLNWARGKVSLNIEIKSEASEYRQKYGVEEKVIELVKDFQMTEFCVVSSFSKQVVRRIKKIDPSQSAAFLVGAKLLPMNLEKVIQKLNADALHLNKELVSEKLVASLKKKGYPVRVYTVNDRSTANDLIQIGVDGLFSDRSDMLMSL